MSDVMTGSRMDMMLTSMSLLWILVIVALVLVVAAAVKYLFFDRKRKD
jgi:flagellar basal body-associated protein FliL